MPEDFDKVSDLLSESSYGEYDEREQYIESFSYKSLFKSSIIMFIFNILFSILSFYIIRPKLGKPVTVGINSLSLTLIYVILSIFNLV